MLPVTLSVFGVEDFLGLLWQHTRGSALLGWVKDDALFIAQRIDAFARSRATSSPQVASEAGSR